MSEMMSDVYLKFWGTRGSLPVSGPMHQKYGGNSSCVELAYHDQHIIIDGGSGLRFLGDELVQKGVKNITLLISHFHNDHLCGIPFFAPLFDPEVTIKIYALPNDEGVTLKQALARYMAPPTYPVGLDIFKANIEFVNGCSGEEWAIGDIAIKSHPIPHPGGCHAYRLSTPSQSIVYATDTEHVIGALNQELADFARQADYLLYDCTYDDDEFDKFIGFGHSTWQEGVRLCQHAEIENLAIIHHAPELTDAMLDERADRAAKIFKNAFVASDFLKIHLNHS